MTPNEFYRFTMELSKTDNPDEVIPAVDYPTITEIVGSAFVNSFFEEAAKGNRLDGLKESEKAEIFDYCVEVIENNLDEMKKDRKKLEEWEKYRKELLEERKKKNG